MTKPAPFPPIPPALVDRLDELFPNRCAQPGMTTEVIWTEAGARKVIDKLRVELAKQQQGPALSP